MTVLDLMPAERVRLPSGLLTVEVERASAPLEHLLDFGVRQNPRRGFLFVSKVLGKHLAVRPHVMWRTHRSLAAALDPLLPGPVAFVGLAETATALGQGVFTAYARRTLRSDLVYLSTTRYRLPGFDTLSFEEAHSHATTHHLHVPNDDRLAACLAEARTIVLIDDELSTGATLRGLAEALVRFAPAVERAVLVSLTDFLGAGRAGVLASFPVPTASVSLLSGSFAFEPDPAWAPELPDVTSRGAHRAPARGGRVGVGAPQGGLRDGTAHEHADALLAGGNVVPGSCALVLGSGEFQWEPFTLALELERRGVDVRFHASTRSPVLPFGPIVERREFLDPYGDGIPNYLYNLLDGGPDHVVMAFETPRDDDPALTPAGVAVERLWWTADA